MYSTAHLLLAAGLQEPLRLSRLPNFSSSEERMSSDVSIIGAAGLASSPVVVGTLKRLIDVQAPA
jgi:hypothetical protein